MQNKYTRIDKVVFSDGEETFMLTHDGIDLSFEVDMTSDFFFNELDILRREPVMSVRSLSEVVRFCEKNGIAFNGRLEKDVLYVGDNANMVVNDKLEYQWWVGNLLTQRVAVTWSMCGYIEVQATTLERAMEMVRENPDNYNLPSDGGDYVDGSFCLTTDDPEEMRAMCG